MPTKKICLVFKRHCCSFVLKLNFFGVTTYCVAFFKFNVCVKTTNLSRFPFPYYPTMCGYICMYACKCFTFLLFSWHLLMSICPYFVLILLFCLVVFVFFCPVLNMLCFISVCRQELQLAHIKMQLFLTAFKGFVFFSFAALCWFFQLDFYFSIFHAFWLNNKVLSVYVVFWGVFR